eukprot:6012094-Pleurochrysis_carterae.AAC.1
MISRNRSGGTRTSMRLTGREEHPAEASSRRNEPPARNIWCLWARCELDARPHQRDLPCDR